MTEINADDEASTVTVVTGSSPDRRWAASTIDITDEGALLVGDGEKDGIDSVFAIYAPGHWTSAALDDHRASSGPDHEAMAAGLEIVLREVEEAVNDSGLTNPGRLDRARDILGRWRETGK